MKNLNKKKTNVDTWPRLRDETNMTNRERSKKKISFNAIDSVRHLDD